MEITNSLDKAVFMVFLIKHLLKWASEGTGVKRLVRVSWNNTYKETPVKGNIKIIKNNRMFIR